MVIGILGESCVGKSTFAQLLKERLNATVYSGKDYLRLAKNEGIARKLFEKKLQDAVNGEHILYVIAEREHLSLLPEGAIRIRMTADLPLIQERFSLRMGGILPLPVAQMLARKHSCFDGEAVDFTVHNSENLNTLCDLIVRKV